ncbi:hypothetical protein FHS23_001260 [Prauserella isguenensis]|uniref:LapA family protein n=1 Tax=Prauserella isguenensis TaxID=1470180 RepID=A0A839RYF2_9PSEU|nr:hypothetical protein [Prauserella isguenensis]MBB3050265.1 hypothetical protein [Prauserella isguenensis]
MLWLFGQIWLWLLVAFALGALAGALLTWPAQRRRAAQAGTDDGTSADGTATGDTHAGDTHTGDALAAPGTTRTGPAGTATFGAVTSGSDAGTGRSDAAPHGSGRQVHDPTTPGHNRGRRRGPRTPDVEQARSAPTDGPGNHIIGTLDEATGAGRTSGTLPPRRAWHTRNEWPDEADEWATEHDIPRSGG